MVGAVTRPRLRAAGLVLPLVAFIGVTFVVPLATMLVRSVYDPVVADALPDTLALLEDWNGQEAPVEAVYAAAARELLRARDERTLGRVASRRTGASTCRCCGARSPSVSASRRCACCSAIRLPT